MPRTEYNSGKWTEAKFHSFVKSALRAASRKWPPKFETINDAYVGTQINVNSGRLAKHFRCAKCAGLFTSTNIQVDHINAIIDPKVGFTNWDDVVSAMFCEKENLQVLCRDCHRLKTKEEREAASKRRKESVSVGVAETEPGQGEGVPEEVVVKSRKRRVQQDAPT